MATDPWYVRELLADVPADEYHAAVEDENWADDIGEEGDETEGEADGEESDESYSEVEEESSSDGEDSSDEGGESMDTDGDFETAELSPRSPAGHVPCSPDYSPPASPESHAKCATPSTATAKKA